MFRILVIAGLLLTRCAIAQPLPNIVYIISDDQAWMDFGFMGNERVHTPRLDDLARQSARFINGYGPSSVCRPSLATLLTGLYPHQHGIHFNHGPPGNSGYNRMSTREEYERIRNREFKLIKQFKTLPGLLSREQGYRVFQSGKFWEGHWRNGGFTDGMTTFRPPAADQRFGGTRILAGGDRVAHGNGDAGLQIGRRTMKPIFDFIEDCQSKGTPWMVWYAPYLPHQPHDSPSRFYEVASSRPNVAKHELPYFASIAEFDESVGKLIDFVEEKSDAKNTLFVFVSDNGWRPSEEKQAGRPQEFAHTKRSKRSPFDDGLRTPILIRWDAVIQPATHTGLASTIDLMPALLDAARVPNRAIPKLPGINLLSVAKGFAPINPDRAIFGEVYPGDASSLGNPDRDIAYRWIRQGEMKLIVPHLHGQDSPWNRYLDTTSMFNVALDPYEQHDVAGKASQQDRVAELHNLLDAWWEPK